MNVVFSTEELLCVFPFSRARHKHPIRVSARTRASA